ncbi:cobalamin biosynthesis protein [Vibrio panuliri]|uniref:Cobalamin biosynthesis protein n=1 Tax=Vibrio panuliri TaxID=1381081 RepID=A0ABX3F3R7_9VIBR|nr:cobalamin biosynthesis protein [Vibrio panuliri]KAB1454020.1 cobalamin biosynthesis protein [Vibrio panuliri]OLQ84434.1 cobalamin biosynthesis protein [Vibrio panuliri]
MKKLAIYAITVNGAQQAERLKRALPFADLFISDAVKSSNSEAQELVLPLARFVAEKFHHYDGHVFICATGIVTRVISPLLQDKRQDPAIVCLDEQATFAISLLSGHRGGANELTQRIAHIVKATPVITTASDVSEGIAADMLGAPFGWVLDPVSEASLTPVSAALVNQQPVVIAQETGEKSWWKYDKRMPANVICHSTLQDIEPSDYQGAILISDKHEIPIKQWSRKLVVWRPKSLVLGLGCDRNTPLSTLQAGLRAFSHKFDLSLDSVGAIASIDLKANELGLIALSQQNQWPYVTYPAEQLDGIEGIENPSDYVKQVTGSNSVAEAAALKHCQSDHLLVAKWAFKLDGYNMTIACCRRSYSESLVQQKKKNWFGSKIHGSAQRYGEKPASGDDKVPVPVKLNAYGNEVVEGYQCKPKHVDLNRPMLHHSHHLLLCEGTRCAKAGSKNLAHDLRNILKEMDLASGERRIKISRTLCAGACRNRATLVIYERKQSGSVTANNALWLKNVDQLSDAEWRAMFNALANQGLVTDVLDQKYFATVESATGEYSNG